MLLVLWLWLFEATCLLLLGFAVLKLLQHAGIGQAENPPIRLFVMGIGFAAVLLMALALFAPLQPWGTLTIAATAALTAVLQHKSLKNYIDKIRNQLPKGSGLIPYFILIPAVLLSASLPPLDYDSALYHMQHIRWLDQFGAVPGLANIHGRFGFNSASLYLQSGFNFRFLTGQFSAAINSLSMLVFLCWLLQLATSKKALASIGFFALIFINFWYYKFQLSSPGTDLLASVLVQVILITILLQNTSENLLFCTISAALATVCKLSVAPILLVPMILWLRQENRIRMAMILPILVAVALLFIPWLILNVIDTGYLLYPAAFTRIGSWDWAVSGTQVPDEYKWVKSWAFLPGQNPDTVLAMPFAERIWGWWKLQGHTSVYLLLASVVNAICLVVLLAFRKTNTSFSPLFAIPIAIAFWLYMAPDIRFGFGFLAISAVIVLLLPQAQFQWSLRLYFPMQILCLLLVTYSGFQAWKQYPGGILQSVANPCRVELVNRSRMAFTGHQTLAGTIYTPVNGDRCYDSVFPVVPNFKNQYGCRGRSFSHGFRAVQK